MHATRCVGLSLLEGDRLLAAVVGVLEWNAHLGLMILALRAPCAGAGRSALALPPEAAEGVPEERLEEVAETAAALAAEEVEALASDVSEPEGLTEPAGAGAATAAGVAEGLPSGGRPEIIALVVVRPELIVLAPLLRVLEYLVGLVYLLELGLRFLGLVDVGVIFPRKLAVRVVYCILGRRAVHAERLVVVFVFHRHCAAPVCA